jgi:hypothetical protein
MSGQISAYDDFSRFVITFSHLNEFWEDFLKVFQISTTGVLVI